MAKVSKRTSKKETTAKRGSASKRRAGPAKAAKKKAVPKARTEAPSSEHELAKGASKAAKARPTAKARAPKKAPARGKPGDPKGLHAAVRAHALGMPGAYEEFPWGESVAKVNKKVFVFLGHAEYHAKNGYGFAVKLPSSGPVALSLPFTEPTGYGLGKSGWVSVSIPPGDPPPLEMLKAWVDESYRAVAPKKMIAELDGRGRH